MGVVDAVTLFVGMDVEKAVVNDLGKTLFELYHSGHYGKDSYYEGTEDDIFLIGEWIDEALDGLHAGYACNRYSERLVATIFIGKPLGQMDTEDELTISVDLNAINEAKNEVKELLLKHLNINAEPEAYVLRSFE